MYCPKHESSMSGMSEPHYEANGDIITYWWCDSCKSEYEVVEAFGGEPVITEM